MGGCEGEKRLEGRRWRASSWFIVDSSLYIAPSSQLIADREKMEVARVGRWEGEKRLERVKGNFRNLADETIAVVEKRVNLGASYILKWINPFLPQAQRS